MDIDVQKFEKYLGQSAKDPYDRYVGIICSFFSNVDGSIKTVVIETGEGVYKYFPISQIVFKDENVIVMPTWEIETRKLINQLETAKKRIKALDELYSKGEIAMHAYQEFKNILEKDLDRLKELSREVKVMLREKMRELDKQIEDIERAMASIKLSFLAGEISEKNFKHVMDVLKRGLDRCVAEKKDVENIYSEVEKVEKEPIVPAIPKKVEVEAPEVPAPLKEKPAAEEVEEPIKIEIIDES